MMERFRILIIGNANAGKTTILEKVCHARGRKPEFLNAEGKKIDSEVKSTAERGEHDIETQIVYPAARGFIFHDSRGFEAGTSRELEKVKAFISDRSKKEDMKDQLHAIWYCLPTSNDRSLTKAEMSLFEIGTGNVPAIAIFTKMDALDKKVFSEQLNKGMSLQQAKQEFQSLAKVKFERDYLKPLKQVPHPPRGIVQLRNMHKSTTECNQLLTTTAKTLDGKTLKLLLLSAQRNNVEFCIEQVVKEVIIPHAQMVLEQQLFSREQQKSLLHDVMSCFPHSLPS
jgi:GTP-binding protein EngB required for normal cell division